MSSSGKSTARASKPANRRRSSSVTQALNQIPLNQVQHAGGHPAANAHSTLDSTSEVQPLSGASRPKGAKNGKSEMPAIYRSKGFWDDLQSGRWMLVPASAFKLMLVPFILYANHELLIHFGLLAPGTFNLWAHFIFPQNKLPDGRYGKSWWDFAFCANYIIFWSFVRQTVTIHVLRPMAKSLEGYTVFYMAVLGSCGIYVMHGLPTWWYKTEYFWLNYPIEAMSLRLKIYYLMQAAYWLQQTIILAARIEKPRKDFKELVAHHIVTLWLIGWSYNVYLTYIGVSVFVTMDVSDVFLALAKCVNYVSEAASPPVFAVFVAVWTYLRHYLNLWILWSVWYEFDLIAPENRSAFKPLDDKWLAPWMKWQIFVPILVLQFINLFWYFLIWRILIRALLKNPLSDDRSDDEDEDPIEGEESTTEKVQAK
ncbi:hypothetical protein IAR55_003630 [Kwoniella newhampshirensis]|uniref:TLC domain-containing protein n=1 Tax=Kwoniella newhampshirensis TaxID=1651941 RepID=A0AAW0YRC0_9TREE